MYPFTRTAFGSPLAELLGPGGGGAVGTVDEPGGPPGGPSGPSTLVGALTAAGLLLAPHSPPDAVPIPGVPLVAAPGSTNRLELVGLADDGLEGPAAFLAGATVRATLADALTGAPVVGMPAGGWRLAAVAGRAGDYRARWGPALPLVAGRRYRLTVTARLGPDVLVLTADVLVVRFGGGPGG